MNTSTRYELCDKTIDFSTLHTDARITDSGHQSTHAPQPHGPQIPSVYKHFAREMVRSAEELFAIARIAPDGLGNKEIATTLGLSQSTERWDKDTADHIVPLGNTAQNTSLMTLRGTGMRLDTAPPTEAQSGSDGNQHHGWNPQRRRLGEN